MSVKRAAGGIKKVLICDWIIVLLVRFLRSNLLSQLLCGFSILLNSALGVGKSFQNCMNLVHIAGTTIGVIDEATVDKIAQFKR
jgi:hypothetical protein